MALKQKYNIERLYYYKSKQLLEDATNKINTMN